MAQQLKDLCCHRSGSGCGCGVGSIPCLAISASCPCCQKKKKKRKKKRLINTKIRALCCGKFKDSPSFQEGTLLWPEMFPTRSDDVRTCERETHEVFVSLGCECGSGGRPLWPEERGLVPRFGQGADFLMFYHTHEQAKKSC